MLVVRWPLCAVVVLCALPLGCDRTSDTPAPGSNATAPAPTSPPAKSPTPPHPVDGEWYRAVVGADLQEVPFFVRMPAPGIPGGCQIVNGGEQLDVTCSWKDGSTIELEFPLFATSIRATRDSSGALLGTWQMSRFAGGARPARFAATRIAHPDPTLRFAADGTSATGAAADFSGTWKFEFATFETGKGIFKQTADGVVTGTIIPKALGDMRYLAGNARGNRLLLSTFNGQQAYVIRADLDVGRAQLTGSYTFSQVMTDRFTAERVSDLDIAVVEKIRLRPGAKRVTIAQLDDPRYRGKPVIVDYFGTWCPACIDQTPFLVDLYRRHHAAGLEVLSIALEGTTDDAYNLRQVERFRTKYKIPWQIVIVPGDFVDSDRLLPPELEGTGGYPVTIFIDRDRTVRAVHSGFFGPAAGEEHQRLTKRYEQHVTAILASSVAPAGERGQTPPSR